MEGGQKMTLVTESLRPLKEPVKSNPLAEMMTWKEIVMV